MQTHSPPSKTKFLSNASWLVSAEVIAKAFRIATLFALAWALSIEQYGIVMLSLALQDMLRILMRCGSGTQIVQCSEINFEQTLYNGIVLQWLLCLLIVIIQIVVGWFAANIYEQPLLFEILCFSAPVYFLFPIVCARVFIFTRQNNMSKISSATAIALSLENSIIATSALLGAGAYSVIYGKYAFAITWLLFFMREPNPAVDGTFSFRTIRHMFMASSKLVTSESARALKMHADLLIAGRVLTPDLLGLYSVARNASIGISQSFVSAIENALFPYLCEINRMNQLTRARLLLVYLILVIAIMASIQSLLVPFYLPQLFGENWAAAIHAAMWLCFAVVPIAFIDTSCAIFRATARFKTEVAIRSYALVALIVCLYFFEFKTLLDFAKTTFVANVGIGVSVGLTLYLLNKSTSHIHKFNTT